MTRPESYVKEKEAGHVISQSFSEWSVTCRFDITTIETPGLFNGQSQHFDLLSYHSYNGYNRQRRLASTL
jgi:hypothetical protein